MNQMTPGKMVGQAAAPRRATRKQGLEIAFDPDADPLDDLAPDPFSKAAASAADAGEPAGDDLDGEAADEAPIRRSAREGAGRGVAERGEDDRPHAPAGPDPAADPRDVPNAPTGPAASARQSGDTQPGAAAGPANRRADPAVAARALGIPVPLAKIEVTVSVEVGRTRLSLADLVSVEPGELVALDRMTHAPVDVLVNGKPFARGEIVAIGERFGVRLTELLDTGDLA